MPDLGAKLEQGVCPRLPHSLISFEYMIYQQRRAMFPSQPLTAVLVVARSQPLGSAMG